MAASTSAGDAGSTVTALFTDVQSAERAYRSALDLGYEASQINLVMSENTRRQLLARTPDSPLERGAAETAETPARGAEIGGPVGGTIGTLAPVVAAVGTAALLPGLVLAGPLAVALAAAGAVGVVGGLIAALTDWGIPHDRVQDYESGIREGGVLMGVKVPSGQAARRLELLWRAAGGRFVQGGRM